MQTKNIIIAIIIFTVIACIIIIGFYIERVNELNNYDGYIKINSDICKFVIIEEGEQQYFILIKDKNIFAYIEKETHGSLYVYRDEEFIWE